MIINKGTEIIEIIIIEVETTKIEIINNNMDRGDSIKETTKIEIISNFKIINNNLTKIKIMTFYDVYDICRHMTFVGYDVCRIMMED